SSRRRHTRSYGDWSSDVCSSDLNTAQGWRHIMIRTGVVASVLMAMVAVGSAEAGPIRSQASGSFVAQGTPIDTNNDGTSADLFIVSGSSSQLGSFTNQTVAEWEFGAPTTTCPAGTVLQGTLVPAGSAFVTRVANGDLLFGRF